MNEPDYTLLIHKSLNGEITDAERVMLDEWLSADPENQKTLDELTVIWNGDWKNGAFKADEEHFLTQRERLVLALEKAKKEEIHTARPVLTHQRIASFALIALCLAIATLYFIQGRLAEPVTITTDRNKNVVLADGSVITLNKNSILTLTQEWNVRIVDFCGEGFFKLAENGKPFVFRLPHGSVTVTGADFFVKVNQGKTEIAVASDSAEISYRGRTILLNENELATITASDNQVSKLISESANFSSWYTGTLEFKKTTLREIAELLEAHYEADFQISDKDALSYSFTGTFVHEELETIIAMLANNMNLIYEYRNGVYNLTPKPRDGVHKDLFRKRGRNIT